MRQGHESDGQSTEPAQSDPRPYLFLVVGEFPLLPPSLFAHIWALEILIAF